MDAAVDLLKRTIWRKVGGNASKLIVYCAFRDAINDFKRLSDNR